ncbi:uncharacterized protein ARMOST_11571 [Armillaria ostoyae]|uniref:Uncharacterized protein n=1 Tax=Armillaria ostoyae TaxID=47428 RepID=A0A284RHI0_ARMOS|nr:uncharacterized protein ARMOST_11571 [Armillaria ostoyae]
MDSLGPQTPYTFALFQTIPSKKSGVTHSLALVTHAADKHTTLVDSTMAHLTTLAKEPSKYLFKNLRRRVTRPAIGVTNPLSFEERDYGKIYDGDEAGYA